MTQISLSEQHQHTGMMWHSAHISHKGNVRLYNEDACLVRTDMNLWAVADGMGGHEAGDVASQTIMQRLASVTLTDDIVQLIDRIDDTLINVNEELRRLGRDKYNNRTIGSTIVSMCAVDDSIAFLWAGDSRIYRVRNNTITQLTRDHSEVQNLIDKGLIKPEEAEFHPSSNIITRAIGAAENLYLSVGVDRTLDNDTYIICSDGLYRELRENEILKRVDARDVETICQDLMNMALSRDARDNITIIIARSQINLNYADTRLNND